MALEAPGVKAPSSKEAIRKGLLCVTKKTVPLLLLALLKGPRRPRHPSSPRGHEISFEPGASRYLEPEVGEEIRNGAINMPIPG